MTTKLVNKHRESNYDISIGRGSKWGNYFTHLALDQTSAKYQVETREQALKEYSYSLLMNEDLLADIPELIDHTLGCSCLPDLCHGQPLVNLSNAFKAYKNSTERFILDFNEVIEIYRLASSQRERAFVSNSQMGLLSRYWLMLTSKEKQVLTSIDSILARKLDAFVPK
jgi:hypothetical protein